nr:uncharacterized protein LOC104652671 [Saimiri boliviensis boliviensis]
MLNPACETGVLLLSTEWRCNSHHFFAKFGGSRGHRLSEVLFPVHPRFIVQSPAHSRGTVPIDFILDAPWEPTRGLQRHLPGIWEMAIQSYQGSPAAWTFLNKRHQCQQQQQLLFIKELLCVRQRTRPMRKQTRKEEPLSPGRMTREWRVWIRTQVSLLPKCRAPKGSAVLWRKAEREQESGYGGREAGAEGTAAPRKAPQRSLPCKDYAVPRPCSEPSSGPLPASLGMSSLIQCHSWGN